MKSLLPQRRWGYVALTLLCVLSAVVFRIGREVVSWRPVLFGHADYDANLTVSPDGHYLVANRKVFVVETGQLIGEVDYGEQCQFSADSKRLAFAYHHDAPGTEKITLYNLPALTLISRTNLKFAEAPSLQELRFLYLSPLVHLSSDLQTVWYMGKHLYSGDLRTGKCQPVSLFQSRSDFGEAWSISADNRFFIASIYTPGTVELTQGVLYRLSDGKAVMHSHPSKDNNIISLSISPDDSFFLETTESGIVHFYDSSNGNVIWQELPWRTVAFSPDSKSFAVIVSGKSIDVREARNPRNVRTLLVPPISSHFTHLAWTPDSQYLFVSDDSGNLWKIRAK